MTPGRLVVVPPFTGGTPSEGIYDAVAEDFSLNVSQRSSTTLQLAAGNFAWARFVESLTFPNGFEERSSGPYSVSGTTITFAGTCGPLVNRSYMFSASAQELVLYREGLLIRFRHR